MKGVHRDLGPNMELRPPAAPAKRRRGWQDVLLAPAPREDPAGARRPAALEPVAPVWEQAAGWKKRFAARRVAGLYTGEFCVGDRGAVRAAVRRQLEAPPPPVLEVVEEVSLEELKRLRGE